jgi:lactose/L-arabinose transport system substrate-binding protein
MKKRFLSLLLVGVLATSSLLMTGCSKGGDSASSGDSEHKLTISAWDESFNQPALEAAAAAYKAQVDPDFELELNMVGSSEDVETAVTTAGSAMDYSTLTDIVLFQDKYIQRYVADYPDAFQPLEADIDWSQFPEDKIAFSTVSGTHYAAPVDNGTVIAAYRTDLLEESGHSIDELKGCTWEKFDEIGKDVYAKTGKYLLCMDGDGNDLPYMMLQAEGVSQWKDNTTPDLAENQTLIEVLEILEKLQDDNVLTFSADWTGYTDELIKGDKVAGVINGNWIIPTIKGVEANSGKWGITTMPTLKGGDGYATNGGSSLLITANCKNTELANKFLAFTFGGGDGAQATYDDALKNGGVVSTWSGAANSDFYQQGDEFFGGQPIYADIVEMGSHVKAVQGSDFHYACRTQIATAITNIHNGTSVTDALKDAQSQLEQTIAGSSN